MTADQRLWKRSDNAFRSLANGYVKSKPGHYTNFGNLIATIRSSATSRISHGSDGKYLLRGKNAARSICETRELFVATSGKPLCLPLGTGRFRRRLLFSCLRCLQYQLGLTKPTNLPQRANHRGHGQCRHVSAWFGGAGLMRGFCGALRLGLGVARTTRDFSSSTSPGPRLPSWNGPNRGGSAGLQ